MIFKLMSIVDMHSLFEDVCNKVGFLTVKFPKSDKLFTYDGKVLSGDRIAVYLQDTGHLVQTSAKDLLVEMTYQTYNLHKLVDEDDYNLALAVYEYYMQDTPREAIDFMYLLSLAIVDYHSAHYPIAISSTVDFIDTLLEERGQSWHDIHRVLGCLESENISSVRGNIEHEFISINDLRALSRFFCLPVDAFIVGGYGS